MKFLNNTHHHVWDLYNYVWTGLKAGRTLGLFDEFIPRFIRPLPMTTDIVESSKIN